jgi:hypothetical protein
VMPVRVSHQCDAYRCINSKRIDLLLVDEECQPRHAIEYQGTAHHQSAAAVRSALLVLVGSW